MPTVQSITRPMMPTQTAPSAPRPTSNNVRQTQSGDTLTTSSTYTASQLERFRSSLNLAVYYAEQMNQDPSFVASAKAAFREATDECLTKEAALRVAESAEDFDLVEEVRNAKAKAAALSKPDTPPAPPGPPPVSAGKVVGVAAATAVGASIFAVLLGAAVLDQQR